MNADAYLRKQGWKGSGHSLDSTGRGIKKPLLIAHKQDQLGLGKKKAAYTTDDQWWMRAYDQSLQSIGTGKESTLNQIRTQGINRGGLYGFFVKGEAIQGTIEDTSPTTTDASVPPSGMSTPATSASDTEGVSTVTKSDKKSKRKREIEGSESNKKSKESNKDAKLAKLAKKEAKKIAKVAAVTQKSSALSSRSKEQGALVAKLAKMKPAKKAEYQARASEKGQSLEKYVLRRIQKKDQKHAKNIAHHPKTAVPYKDYKPQFYRFPPLGLDPKVWEREVLESNFGRTGTEQYKYEKPPCNTSSASSTTQSAARESKQAGSGHKARLRSPKAAKQLQSTDLTGTEDNLALGAWEEVKEGHSPTSRVIHDRAQKSHTYQSKAATMAIPETNARSKKTKLKQEKKRRIVEKRRASVLNKKKKKKKKTKEHGAHGQEKWKIRIDS